MNWFRTLTAILLALCVSPPALSDTYVIPFSDLSAAAGNEDVPPDQAISRYLAGLILGQIDDAGLNFAGGELLGGFPIDAVTEIIETRCTIPTPYEAHMDATTAAVALDDNSSITINLASLDSISVSAALTGRVSATASAWVRWGQDIPFGADCAKFDTDHGWISVIVPFALDLTIDLSLAPAYDAEQIAIVVDKMATISGGITIGESVIDYDFGPVSLTELVLLFAEDQLVAKIKVDGQRAVERAITSLDNRANGLDADGNPDPSIEAFNGPTTFVVRLSESDEIFVRDVLVSLGIPDIVISMLGDRGIEILLQLAILEGAERDAFLAGLGADLGCEILFSNFRTVLDRVPIYHQDAGSCIAADVLGPAKSGYFLDSACSQPVAFQPADENEYCQSNFGDQSELLIGNAASWAADTDQVNDAIAEFRSRKWTVVPSSELDIGTVSIADNQLPYMKQLHYRTVDGHGGGSCELEMRVYKSDIAAAGLRPLIALHGGTWKNRGFSFLGLEASVSMFTNRGFVVFLPFYRLAGQSDGNMECNDVSWREITDDVEYALEWVQANGANLGAANEQVSVFGQSAGAHLAAWLAAHRPTEVRKALLFYGPYDALSFLAETDSGDPALDEFRDFAFRSLATLYGARGSSQELRLDNMSFAGLTPGMLRTDWQTLIPGTVFDLSSNTTSNPSIYLARCASLTGTDLALVNLAQPPEELANCLKEDFRDFLVDNSFYELLRDEQVPLYALHGSADTLVPFAQSVDLCASIDDSELPRDVVDDETVYQCGSNSEARIVRAGEHALDLGLCVDTLCPAGPEASGTRLAAVTAIDAGYAWLLDDPVQDEPPISVGPTSSDTTPAANNGGGNGLWLAILCLVLMMQRCLEYRCSSGRPGAAWRRATRA